MRSVQGTACRGDNTTAHPKTIHMYMYKFIYDKWVNSEQSSLFIYDTQKQDCL